ncbi:MAG: hypothetical protein AVDCRST_MAG08-3055, partial [uncultured Acetobacteraceae bacterium]
DRVGVAWHGRADRARAGPPRRLLAGVGAGRVARGEAGPGRAGPARPRLRGFPVPELGRDGSDSRAARPSGGARLHHDPII